MKSSRCATVQFAEEPISGTMVPVTLESNIQDDSHPGTPVKVLLGMALRVKRIVMVDVQVYVLAVYGDPDEVVDAASSTGVDSPQQLLTSLHQSVREKVFCLTFLRAVSGPQLVDGLRESLCQIAGVPAEDVATATQHIPSSVPKASQLRIVTRPQSGEVEFSSQTIPGVGGVFQLPDFVRGLHEVYLGPRAVVRGLGESMQRQRALLLAREGSDAGADEESNASNAGDSFDCVWQGRQSTPDAPASSDASTAVSPGQSFDTARSEGGGANPNEGPEQPAMTPRRLERLGSWREAAGRSKGGDRYKFGDLTRTLFKKAQSRTNSFGEEQSPSLVDQGSDEPWLGALSLEGEADPWVSIDAVPTLDASALTTLRVEGSLFKHHTSPVRGVLVPQWSNRHFELKGGALQYSRRLGGKSSGKMSLDGAQVVAEPPKVSNNGECFVFRVISGGVSWRLSCPQTDMAVRWVVSISAVCAFYRGRRYPAEAKPPSAPAVTVPPLSLHCLPSVSETEAQLPQPPQQPQQPKEPSSDLMSTACLQLGATMTTQSTNPLKIMATVLSSPRRVEWQQQILSYVKFLRDSLNPQLFRPLMFVFLSVLFARRIRRRMLTAA